MLTYMTSPLCHVTGNHLRPRRTASRPPVTTCWPVRRLCVRGASTRRDIQATSHRTWTASTISRRRRMAKTTRTTRTRTTRIYKNKNKNKKQNNNKKKNVKKKTNKNKNIQATSRRTWTASTISRRRRVALVTSMRGSSSAFCQFS